MNKQAIDIGINVGWPILFLSVLSDRFTPVQTLLLALAGPLAYALYGIVSKRKVSGLSALAVGGVLLSGGIGLLELDARWFAAKEALLPGAIGLAVAVSTRTAFPVVRTVLWEAMDGAKVDAALAAKGETAAFARTLTTATLRFGGLLVLTGLVSALVAWMMVTSPAGSAEYNAEVGSYTGYSFLFINLPSVAALVYVLSGVLTDLEARTGLVADELMGRKS